MKVKNTVIPDRGWFAKTSATITSNVTGAGTIKISNDGEAVSDEPINPAKTLYDQVIGDFKGFTTPGERIPNPYYRDTLSKDEQRGFSTEPHLSLFMKFDNGEEVEVFKTLKQHKEELEIYIPIDSLVVFQSKDRSKSFTLICREV